MTFVGLVKVPCMHVGGVLWAEGTAVTCCCTTQASIDLCVQSFHSWLLLLLLLLLLRDDGLKIRPRH
jgi:hypothetical protein